MSNQEPDIDFLSTQNKVQFYRAGAGAGKTTTLIATCIGFAQQFKIQNNRYPRMIITTFTKKATQEIKERLIIKALETGDEELFQYFNKKSFVQIGTIHNVLSQFIRQHSESIGLPADLAIVNDYKIFYALKKHMKNFLDKNADFPELLEHFRFDQLMKHLIEAVNLKAQYPDFKNISLKQMQDTASQERNSIVTSINQFLSETAIHADKFQPHYDYLNLIKAAILAQDYTALIQAFEMKPDRKYTLNRKAPEVSKELDAEIAALYKEDFLTPASFDQYLKITDHVQSLFFRLVAEAENFLTQTRLSTGEMSIGDLELISMKILTENPKAMQQFSAQYDFIMVDEYQDTSPLQVKILDQLMKEKNQFIVGDPQQSIYLFRGARSEVFTNKENEINQSGYPTKLKLQNYRSHARLMTFMNDFFKSYSTHPGAMQFKPMEPKDSDFKARNFNDITFVTSVEFEFGAIVQQAQKLHALGIPFSEITVLFKKNSDILEFAKYANTYNLPVQVQISKGFEGKAEVSDLLALLRFLINPYDSENLICLLRSPWFTISDQEIIDIRQDTSTHSFWAQLKKANHAIYKTLKDIESVYLEKGVSEAIFYFIQNSLFLTSAAYFDPTSLREANIWKFLQTIMANEVRTDFNLSEFVNHELTQFTEDLSSSDGEGVPLIEANRVSLMTVHGSKGLQFKHVIICGFNDLVRNSGVQTFTFDEESSRFALKVLYPESDKPTAIGWAESIHEKYMQRAREENDRVLYVAMTRAIESLTLIRLAKNPPKTSWLEKIIWNPENYVSNKYSVEFVEFNQEPEAFAKEATAEIVAKKPLELTKTAKISAGVTTLISNELPYEKASVSESVHLGERTVKAYNKTQKGTDLHKFFEALKYNQLDEINNQLIPPDREALRWLMDVQKDVDLRAIFDNGHVEWGFGLEHNGTFIQGQIDAWGTINQDLYILDYKTGSTEYLDKAFDQLKAYAACLKLMGYVKSQQSIKLAVLYPFDQKVAIKQIFEPDVQLELTT